MNRCVLLLVLLAGCSSSPSTRPAADPAKQAERMAFVQQMMDLGAVHKFEPNLTVPRLYVKEPFYQLTIDQKQKMVDTIFAYCEDGSGATVMTVHDYQSGKEIGDVTHWRGFKME